MKTQHYIDLRINNFAELLLPPGTPSFCKRKLNLETEEYIIEEASNLPERGNIGLRIQIADNKETSNDIALAIHYHFAYCGERARKNKSIIVQKGWRTLLVAIVFLMLMIILSSFLVPMIDAEGIAITIREILIILAWVALWRPADLLLYDWRPYKRDTLLFKRLEQSDVQLIKT